MTQQLSRRTIAVLGASNQRTRFSNKAVRALAGKVAGLYPIHPKSLEIENVPCFPSIVSLPIRPDILSVYLSDVHFLPLMDQIETHGCGEIWLNPGADSDEVLRELMKRNLPFRQTCTILETGFKPSDFPDA
jgi:predicted CoA-binding protein